jgi:hypothetical protein
MLVRERGEGTLLEWKLICKIAFSYADSLVLLSVMHGAA